MEDNKYQTQLEIIKDFGYNPIGIITWGGFTPSFIFETEEESENCMADGRFRYTSYYKNEEMIPIYENDGDIIWLNK